MATSLSDIIERLDNLEQSFRQSQINNVPVTQKADEASGKVPQVDTNTSDIVTTQEGLAETYEEMTSSIIEVEEALAEVYEMIIDG